MVQYWGSVNDVYSYLVLSLCWMHSGKSKQARGEKKTGMTYFTCKQRV